jgi:catechol 2,3-dioxygenase-like lactoylglutathione lyase family enzyme
VTDEGPETHRGTDVKIHIALMSGRPKLLGVNHVALEVADLDEALEFYGRIFQFELRGRMSGMAFLDMGDQFLALSEGRSQPPDTDRHFGLVVDDKEAVREALREAGVDPAPGRGLNFRDPWGNLVQVVDYRDIQFTKAPNVLRGMGLEALKKRPEARAELRAKGLL